MRYLILLCLILVAILAEAQPDSLNKQVKFSVGGGIPYFKGDSGSRNPSVLDFEIDYLKNVNHRWTIGAGYSFFFIPRFVNGYRDVTSYNGNGAPIRWTSYTFEIPTEYYGNCFSFICNYSFVKNRLQLSAQAEVGISIISVKFVQASLELSDTIITNVSSYLGLTLPVEYNFKRNICLGIAPHFSFSDFPGGYQDNSLSTYYYTSILRFTLEISMGIKFQ